jgi:hypothetical protein
MREWMRIADGWAFNLDGSSATAQITFPRLELHASPSGWWSLCLQADGMSSHSKGSMGTLSEAKRAAAEQARRLLGPAYAAILGELLGDR